MANTLTLLIWKADAVALAIWTTFTLTLWICNRRTGPEAECPDIPHPEGRCRSLCGRDDICLDTRHPEEIIPDTPHPEGRCLGAYCPDYICLDSRCPEGIIP